MIQIHRLEGFFWVATTGGYARAARAFPYPITQPAVHQQVKKLERELGTVLFERVGKDRMQLTAAGRHLFAFVSPFFEGLPGVVRSLREDRYGGVLRILAEPLMLRHMLPAWIRRLRRARPDVRVDLRELSDPDTTALRAGDADLVVGYLPDVGDDVETRRVGTLWPFWVLPATHPLAKRSRMRPKDLEGDTFVSYSPGLLAHDLQMRALARHDLIPERVVSAGSADTILGFVESGVGYSLLPSLERDGPRGFGIVARRLSTPGVEYPVVAAWRRNAPPSPLLRAALDVAPSSPAAR